ncbi:MAG: phytanoyl-CoA dioxygenase family protein [Rhizobiaceae bacterium]|nr:phytanoyl-CoA dioxygenase family protein [Hyphomicrobiales bacterium]NRB32516.1 phytanoyl-CoA dioxygenase family protein [Rhizobiaceae bacterium]
MAAHTTNNINQNEVALAWAKQHFLFESSSQVTNHPWATTFRLTGRVGSAYLKTLPALEGQVRQNHVLQAVADRFSPAVPELLASDTESGFFLYRDHEGQTLDSGWNSELRNAVLKSYAKIQVEAVSDAHLLNILPVVKCSDQFALLLEFLADEPSSAPKIDGSLAASYFLGSKKSREYLTILDAARSAFEALLSPGDQLPLTINHCDLRVKNVARRSDDSLVIFDWDDAVAAPPGLSLHALFSGSFRPIAALTSFNEQSGSQLRRDRRVLDAYVAELTADGDYEAQQLQALLPGVLCAGVIHYLLSFADYPVADEKLRAQIGKNMSRRFSDLLDVAQYVVGKNGEEAEQLAFAGALRQAGRNSRAERFTKTWNVKSAAPRLAIKSSEWIKEQITQSDKEGVFPSITLSDNEQQDRKITSHNGKLAVELFKRHGTLMVNNAIPTDLVERCHGEFMDRYERYFHDERHSDALRVGDKRFMITLDFDGGFADPNLFASPLVTPMLKQLLSPEFVLGSLTAVASLPGSADQRLHKDNQALFPEVDDGILPSFSIAMIVPLIPLDQETGATRVVKGSHRHSSSESKKMPYQDPTVPLGSCFFMDSRLTHQGLANNSTRVRPIVSIVYQRPWYHDNLNYKKQKPVNISAQQFEQVPDDLKHLVEWAV